MVGSAAVRSGRLVGSKGKTLNDTPLLDTDQYLDGPGLARVLGVSIGWVHRNGKSMPGTFVLGRKRLYRRADVMAWVEAGCPALGGHV